MSALASHAIPTPLTDRLSHTTRVPSPLDRALSAGNWPVLHPDGTHWLVASASRPGLDYTITTQPGSMTCDCLAGRFGETDCKHRAAVRYCLEHGVRAAYALCAGCHTRRVAKAGQCCVFCRPERPLCPHCHTEVVETPGEWCAGCAAVVPQMAAESAPAFVGFACSRNGRAPRLPRDRSRTVLQRRVAEHVQNPVPSPRQASAPMDARDMAAILQSPRCVHCGMRVLDPMHELSCNFA